MGKRKKKVGATTTRRRRSTTTGKATALDYIIGFVGGYLFELLMMAIPRLGDKLQQLRAKLVPLSALTAIIAVVIGRSVKDRAYRAMLNGAALGALVRELLNLTVSGVENGISAVSDNRGAVAGAAQVELLGAWQAAEPAERQALVELLGDVVDFNPQGEPVLNEQKIGAAIDDIAADFDQAIADEPL